MKKTWISFLTVFIVLSVNNAKAGVDFTPASACDSLWAKGMRYLDQSELDQALDALLDFKRCDSASEKVNGYIGYLYIELNRFKEAESFLEQIVTTYPNDYFSLYLWGNVNRISGNHKVAVSAYEKVYAAASQNLQWDFYFYYGWSSLQNGNSADARALFEYARFLTKGSKDELKLSFTLISLFLEKDPAYALEISNSVIGSCSDYYELILIHSWRTICYLNLSDHKKAGEEIDRGKALAGDSLAFPYILESFVLLKANKTFEEIQPPLTKALSISEDPKNLRYAAYVNAYFGKEENSCRLYMKYLDESGREKIKPESDYLCKGKVSEGFDPVARLPKLDTRDLLLDVEYGD